jgi:hypothetical protein
VYTFFWVTLYSHLWPVRFYHVFPHYLINCTIFRNELLNVKYIFWFSLQLRLKYFPFWEELSEILTQMYIGLHVNYPLFLLDFNVTWIFSTEFRNALKYRISLKSVLWELSCFHADRQTDITTLTVAFSSFRKRLRILKTYKKTFMITFHPKYLTVGW